MKLFGFVLCLLMGSTSFASTAIYEIKADISVVGRAASQARVTVAEAEEATITVGSPEAHANLKFVVSMREFRGIEEMHVELKYGVTPEQGTETFKGSAHLIVSDGGSWRFGLIDENGGDILSVNATVTKITP